MREKIEIEIVRKHDVCFCIEGRLYLKEQCSIKEMEKLLEEADTIPKKYSKLYDDETVFCMCDISRALYDSVKRLQLNGFLTYNGNVVTKVSANLYHVEVSD